MGTQDQMVITLSFNLSKESVLRVYLDKYGISILGKTYLPCRDLDNCTNEIKDK